MCHEQNSRPPPPPIAGAADGAGPAGEDLVLTAKDGNRFAAFLATPGGRAAPPGVLIVPDVRGLHPFYRDLALRFAQAGVCAIALDLFGRTAGVEPHPEEFDYWPHVQQLTPDGIGADTAAALAHLRSPAGCSAARTYSVGFCMGGRISFNQAWRHHGVDGVIGFYGGPQGRGPDDDTAPIRLAPHYRCKVLGLFGGADEAIPPEAIEEFRTTLDGAGVPNEIVVYDGAPHSFFDRRFDEHREACEDAWRRVLGFIGAPGAPAA
jgi:carboxymethylenebutenolidase